jgi:hypothetical protein
MLVSCVYVWVCVCGCVGGCGCVCGWVGGCGCGWVCAPVPLLIIPPPPFARSTEADVVLNLLSPEAHDNALLPNALGEYVFEGQKALAMRTFRGVTTQFSLLFVLKQSPDNSGYLISKSTLAGSRFYSLYASALSRAVFLYYRIAGSAVQRRVVFPVALNDGIAHTVLLSVRGREATFRVDGRTISTQTLDGLIDDCGVSSQDCILDLGQRSSLSGKSFFFKGAISDARIFYTVAL